MNSNSKVPTIKRRRFDWATFDAQPRQIKEVLWDTPQFVFLDSVARPSYTPALRAKLAPIFARSCEATYGASHPQSFTRQNRPTSADLDL